MLLSGVVPMLAQDADDNPTADGLLDSRRTIWYDPDTYDHPHTTWRKLEARHALVGPGCEVNKLISAVGVGAWADSLGNVTNEDLTDYATFPSVLKAGVTVNPIVSVRDFRNYYAEGTEAGFCVVASSGTSVLTLDVVKAMSIVFYRDGKLGSTVPVEEGQSAGGVNLQLIKIPGSDDACICLTARSKEMFDEVCLQPTGGVNLDLGSVLKVKYAFVGRDHTTLLTHTGAAAIGATVEASGQNPVLLGIPFPMTSEQKENLLDDDLTNGAAMTPFVGLAYMGGVKIEAKPTTETDKGQEVFEAGTEVGFKYKNGAVLDLSVGSWAEIELYDRKGNCVQTETLNAGVLKLGVADGGDGTASVLASVPYSGARIAFYGGLKVYVGSTVVYYGYVKSAPVVPHHCDIRPTPSTNICSGQTSFQLHSNPAVSVKWTLLLQPDGASARVTASGYVTGMNLPGSYTFRATAADGCTEDVTLVVDDDLGTSKDEHCGTDFVNLDQAAYGTYSLMDSNIPDGTGALVSISGLENGENLLDPDYSNYASYVGGLGVANNLAIAGVKRTDGEMYDGTVDGQGAANVGFIVESDNEVIDAKVLEFFQIRCYQDGEEVYRHVITESNAVGAGVGTSTKTQKVRFCIRVEPIDKDAKPIRFNEIVLWKSGVLDLGLSKLKLYYAFVEDANSTCANALGCGATVLSDTTGTRLNADACQMAGAVSVAGVDDNLSCFVDGNLETAMTIVSSVNVGAASVIAVNMGRTYDFRHQLGIVTDQKTYALGATVGGWLTVETYYQGKPTGDKFTDWNVLGANVAGYGDKSLLLMQPKEIYDEVRLTLAGVVSALDIQKFYGIFVRGDIDNDGVPDCKDTESCQTTISDIQIADVCQGGEIHISGKGNTGTDYAIFMREQGIDADHGGAFQTAQDGSFSLTFTMSRAGRYSMLFYDASGNLLTSVPYTVHPNQTTWRRDAQTADWREWNNWTEGSPYCCTNVVIPSGATRYPVLALTADATADDGGQAIDAFCCNNVLFEPGAAVGHTPRLNYHQAWTEVSLQPNRYYLLSPTLQQTYSGDWFVPAEMNGVHTATPFTEVNATTAPENRFSPRIYQRLWDHTAPVRLASTEEQTVSLTETRWSQRFNHLKYAYAAGEGFSLWADNETLPADRAVTFLFPKMHTEYNYFNDYDHQIMPGLRETDLDRTGAGRFVYEPLTTEGNLTAQYSGYIDGSEQTQQRTVYPAGAQLSLSLSVGEGEEAQTMFLAGNPFQSYINIASLLKENAATIKAVKLYDGNTVNSSVSADGQLVGDAQRISPGEAFFVETNAACKSLSLKFSEEMLTDELSASNNASSSASSSKFLGTSAAQTAPSPYGFSAQTAPSAEVLPAQTAPSPYGFSALKLSLRNDSTGVEASSYLLTAGEASPSVTSRTLFDADVRPAVSLFSLRGGEALDLQTLSAEGTPLGLYCAEAGRYVLSAQAKGRASLDDYVLLDRLTGSQQSLSQPLTFNFPKGGSMTAGRYVVCLAAGSTASGIAEVGLSGKGSSEKETLDAKIASELQLSVAAHSVSAELPEPLLHTLEAFTPDGRLVASQRTARPTRKLSLQLESGLYLLRLNGVSTVKVWVE